MGILDGIIDFFKDIKRRVLPDRQDQEFADKEKLETDLDKLERNAREAEGKGNPQIEDEIREAFFHGVKNVNRKFAARVPIGYDAEADLWLVNDFSTHDRKGNSVRIPIEIKIKYDPQIEEFTIVDYSFQGKSYPDQAAKFQSVLNEDAIR